MTSGARAALSTGNPVLGSHILVAPESASHRGHVSNLCGLEHAPLEPVQPLSDQGRAGRTGTCIQTGRPAGIILERPENGAFEPGIQDPW